MRNDTGIQPVFIISVDDPQKVGDPIRSFTMYTVHTRVSRLSSPIRLRLSLPSHRQHLQFFENHPSLFCAGILTSSGSTERCP